MAGDTASGYPTTLAANYTLFLLWGIYVSNQWARYILNYLYAISSDSGKYSISQACSLSTSEYGLLTGYGFSATFVITGLFMGRAADTYNRRNIIVAGCLIWNIALAAQGAASSFWELLLFRLLLGFGEAFSNPASYSMITDLFPKDKLPEANGIYASGVYIGGAMASISMSIAEAIGWRAIMFITAATGALMGCTLLLTASEPTRMGLAGGSSEGKEGDKKASGSQAKPTGPTVYDTCRFLLTDPHTLVLLAGASVRFCGGYAIAGYLPTFFEEKFPSKTTQYAFINAYVVAFGGFMSSWLGGKLTTRWIESGKATDPSKVIAGHLSANYYVPAIGALGGLPFFAVTLFASNFYVALCLGLLGEYLIAECWFGPFMSALQSGVPPTMRGMAVSFMMLFGNFFGSLTSYLIGLTQERMDNGYLSLETILCVTVGCTYVLAAVLFLAASRIQPSSEVKQHGSPSERTKLLSSPRAEEEEAA